MDSLYFYTICVHAKYILLKTLCTPSPTLLLIYYIDNVATVLETLSCESNASFSRLGFWCCIQSYPHVTCHAGPTKMYKKYLWRKEPLLYGISLQFYDPLKISTKMIFIHTLRLHVCDVYDKNTTRWNNNLLLRPYPWRKILLLNNYKPCTGDKNFFLFL